MDIGSEFLVPDLDSLSIHGEGHVHVRFDEGEVPGEKFWDVLHWYIDFVLLDLLVDPGGDPSGKGNECLAEAGMPTINGHADRSGRQEFCGSLLDPPV